MANAALNVPRLLAVSKVPTLIGQCVPIAKGNVAKIKVKRLQLDTNLLAYFYKNEYVYATDPDKLCKPGDIVLVDKLPENLSKLISHKVSKIVHSYGDTVDPITGKKAVNSMYREELDMETDMFGRLPTTFDYEKAPPRGWQEHKKDFTGRPTYQKYHVYPEEDPYAI